MFSTLLQSERRMYLACKSDASLDHVCVSLEQSLGLDVFDRDAEDSWVYARSAGAGFGFNITRTEGTDTIATWMPSAPHDVNYQVILTYCGAPDTAAFQRVRSALQRALNTEPQIYHEA
jgi:hypothetical protein